MQSGYPVYKMNKGNCMSKEITWDPKFAPSYTPEEMLRMGVFEGKYINNIKEVPQEWKKIDKVLKLEDEPDPKINKYGVKSRQSLSVWRRNGWIKTDANGFFHWAINYFLGRRLGKEDDWQIGRWNSFVARHQGQINADPKSKNKDHRLVQKQALLQWGWEWETMYTEEQKAKNAKRIARIAGVPLEEPKSISQESIMIIPNYAYW